MTEYAKFYKIKLRQRVNYGLYGYQFKVQSIKH